nr:ubiquitin carboxyl-terminal hydrolase 20-like [Pocillopora verrucosa]
MIRNEPGANVSNALLNHRDSVNIRMDGGSSQRELNHEYPANENVDVHFISLRWFRLWEMFEKGQEDDPPGPIDNSNIIVLKGNTKVLN